MPVEFKIRWIVWGATRSCVDIGALLNVLSSNICRSCPSASPAGAVRTGPACLCTRVIRLSLQAAVQDRDIVRLTV